MRILVTGSRDWDDYQMIRGALFEVAVGAGEAVTLVEGGAKGADRLAKAAARQFGWQVEEHPAQWDRYGPKRAGYVRNAAMVAAGADLCLAFIRNNSPGATMCATLAERAGITTLRFTVNDDEGEDR